MKQYGNEEDDICNRDFCTGIIKLHKSENCSCHINPPCSSCTSARHYCEKCDWEESEEIQINDFTCTYKQGVYKWMQERELDKTKIDWRSHAHTHFSMRKEGCYPEGTKIEEVLKLVKGTFGGRFTHFNNGLFEYIAYTD